MSVAGPDLYAVGKVVKVFGVKGEVVVRPTTHSPHRFRKLKRVFVGRPGVTAREYTIEQVHIGTRGVRVKLSDLNDRDAAEKIIGSHIFVDARDRVRIPRGTFFIHDVLGLTVLDQDGNALGTVKELMKLPAHDVLVVEQNGREVLVPSVKEFIRSIDLNTKTMRVHILEGMVE